MRFVAGVVGIIGAVLRPALRFTANLVLLAATIALMADLTRWQTGAGGPTFQSLDHHVVDFAPASRETFAQTVTETMHPWVWDPLLLGILGWPAWMVFAAVGVALLWAGRERREVSIYIN